MNLKEFKKKMDTIYKSYRSTKHDLKDINVILETNDALFGTPHTEVKDVSIGFDFNHNKILLSTNDKIYLYDNYHDFITNDDLKDIITNPSSEEKKYIYHIVFNNKKLTPFFETEESANEGLVRFIEHLNEKVDYINDILNYDHYYDYIKLKNGSYIGGEEKKDCIYISNIELY